uniref:Uncharacterized protein n=1 Tax=Opuntia streptacantha TaxID=393608 RepID=A0A7C8ZZL3_OPUST
MLPHRLPFHAYFRVFYHSVCSHLLQKMSFRKGIEVRAYESNQRILICTTNPTQIAIHIITFNASRVQFSNLQDDVFAPGEGSEKGREGKEVGSLRTLGRYTQSCSG